MLNRLLKVLNLLFNTISGYLVHLNVWWNMFDLCEVIVGQPAPVAPADQFSPEIVLSFQLGKLLDSVSAFLVFLHVA